MTKEEKIEAIIFVRKQLRKQLQELDPEIVAKGGWIPMPDNGQCPTGYRPENGRCYPDIG